MALGSSKLVKAPAPSFTDANTDLKNVSMPSPRAAMCFCAATSQQPVPYSNIAVAVDFLFASWPQVNRHRHGQSASQASPWLPALPPHPSPPGVLRCQSFVKHQQCRCKAGRGLWPAGDQAGLAQEEPPLHVGAWGGVALPSAPLPAPSQTGAAASNPPRTSSHLGASLPRQDAALTIADSEKDDRLELRLEMA